MYSNWYKTATIPSAVAPEKQTSEAYAWIWDGGELKVVDGALHGALVASDYPGLDNMFRGTYWVDDDYMAVIAPRKAGDFERKGVEHIPNSLYDQLSKRFGHITNIEVL